MADLTTRKVIAGPSGHWYALLAGSLYALPQSAGEEDPPEWPGTLTGVEIDRAGWYAPDDLQGEEREQVLAELATDEGEEQ